MSGCWRISLAACNSNNAMEARYFALNMRASQLQPLAAAQYLTEVFALNETASEGSWAHPQSGGPIGDAKCASNRFDASDISQMAVSKGCRDGPRRIGARATCRRHVGEATSVAPPWMLQTLCALTSGRAASRSQCGEATRDVFSGDELSNDWITESPVNCSTVLPVAGSIV